MSRHLRYIRDPKVVLVYPPDQSLPNYTVKPNGALAYPYLAGALRDIGVDVTIFDACVGAEADDLLATFYRSTPLPNGLVRTGVSDARILEEVADADVVGITSMFTNQESMVLHVARLVKNAFPDKLIISGGVNARNRIEHFLDNGVDVVFLSEAEAAIQQVLDCVRRGASDFTPIRGVAFRHRDRTVVNPLTADGVVWELDDLPMPAWDLLPLERYWQISRPHGGYFPAGTKLRYGNIMTSRGCVFRCSFCHIGGELDGSVSGPLARFRIKSDERVLRECEVLKNLGVEQLYIEDDTLFGHKNRAIRLLHKIREYGFDVMDINGINVVHMFDRRGPDHEVLDAMVSAGFREITLAFESSSQRILKKYVANKWVVGRHDIEALMRELDARGIRVVGNYMIGYPDETLDEINETIAMAIEHRAWGMLAANFFLVMPLPGTPLFEIAIKEGYFSADFDPDMFHWIRPSMKNTRVPADELNRLREAAWLNVNAGEWIRAKQARDRNVPL